MTQSPPPRLTQPGAPKHVLNERTYATDEGRLRVPGWAAAVLELRGPQSYPPRPSSALRFARGRRERARALGAGAAPPYPGPLRDSHRTRTHLRSRTPGRSVAEAQPTRRLKDAVARATTTLADWRERLRTRQEAEFRLAKPSTQMHEPRGVGELACGSASAERTSAGRLVSRAREATGSQGDGRLGILLRGLRAGRVSDRPRQTAVNRVVCGKPAPSREADSSRVQNTRAHWGGVGVKGRPH